MEHGATRSWPEFWEGLPHAAPQRQLLSERRLTHVTTPRLEAAGAPAALLHKGRATLLKYLRQLPGTAQTRPHARTVLYCTVLSRPAPPRPLTNERASERDANTCAGAGGARQSRALLHLQTTAPPRLLPPIRARLPLPPYVSVAGWSTSFS